MEHLPPHSNEMEEAVLGSLLIDPDAFFDVSHILNPESFYRQQNRWIYESICNLYGKRSPVDLITICEELGTMGRLGDIGGESAVIGLINATPTSINAERYAKTVADKATRRRMIKVASKIANSAYNESEDLGSQLSECEFELLRIRSDQVEDNLHKPRQYMSEFISHYQAVADGEVDTRIPTGYKELDRILDGGFERSQLIIAGGRPSMGKSALCVNIADNQARDGLNVLYFSLEMTEKQIVNRRIAHRTGIKLRDIKKARVPHEKESSMYDAAGQMSEENFFIDTTAGAKPSHMRAVAMRLHAEYGLDIIYSDHLGLTNPDKDTGNVNTDLGKTTKALFELGKALGVPVVCAHQLSKRVEQRQDKRPILSDLRDSGHIEQDAHTVIFVYRDDYYNGEGSDKPNVTELIVSKHRDGETGTVNMFWKRESASFRDLEINTVQF